MMPGWKMFDSEDASSYPLLSSLPAPRPKRALGPMSEPTDHLSHFERLPQALHSQVAEFLPIEPRHFLNPPTTSPLPQHQPGMFRLALTSRSLRSTYRRFTARIVLPLVYSSRKKNYLLPLLKTCGNLHILTMTFPHALPTLSLALTQGFCSHLRELHILSEESDPSHRRNWKMDDLALVLEVGALPCLEIFSVGPGVAVEQRTQLLRSLKDGRICPLLQELHFEKLDEGNVFILAEVLQARAAIGTAKGLTRLEGVWTAGGPTSLEAIRQIAHLVLPTLEELPKNIDKNAEPFAQCMKLTPSWSVRRVRAMQKATSELLLDALSHRAAPNVEEIYFPKLAIDARVIESWQRGKENKSLEKVKLLALGLHITSEQVADDFVKMISGADDGDDNGDGGGSGRCEEAFFPEVRRLVVDSSTHSLYEGAVWTALMEKACPRLETVRAFLTYESLKDIGMDRTAAPITAASPSLSSSSSSLVAASSVRHLPPHSSSTLAAPSPIYKYRFVTELTFSEGFIKREDLELFAAFMQDGQLPSLQLLQFGECCIAEIIITLTSICQALPALPQLHTLCLPGMTNESVKALAEALSNGALPRLEKLFLSSIPMGSTAAGPPLIIQDSAFLPFTAALAEGAGTMLKDLDFRLLHMSENGLGVCTEQHRMP